MYNLAIVICIIAKKLSSIIDLAQKGDIQIQFLAYLIRFPSPRFGIIAVFCLHTWDCTLGAFKVSTRLVGGMLYTHGTVRRLQLHQSSRGLRLLWRRLDHP